MKKTKRTVTASNFMGTMARNVGNLDMTDAEFREVFRNTVPIVAFDHCERIEKEMQDKLSAKNLNEMFAEKEVRVMQNGLEILCCVCKFISNGSGDIIEIGLYNGSILSFIPDSISTNNEKVEGKIPPTNFRLRIELV